MNDQIFQTPLNKRSYAADFRQMARKALANRWWLAIGVFLLAVILHGSSISVGFGFSLNGLDTDDFLETVKTFGQIWNEDPNSAVVYLRDFVTANTSGWIGILITSAITSLSFSLALSVFVGSPVSVGYARFNLDLIDGKKETGVGTLFGAFSTCYWKSIGVRVLVGLITGAISVVVTLSALALTSFGFVLLFTNEFGGALFLLLLFAAVLVAIAGSVLQIFVSYHYSMCSFILAECPTLGVVDILRNSRILMRGNKWRLFCLHISFIGWILLAACCTCGLGMFAVSPYMNAADAAFYDEISQRSTAKEVEFPSINPDDYFPG